VPVETSRTPGPATEGRSAMSRQMCHATEERSFLLRPEHHVFHVTEERPSAGRMERQRFQGVAGVAGEAVSGAPAPALSARPSPRSCGAPR
jgi:hypothetical protein